MPSTPQFLKRSELSHTSRHRTWTHAAKCGDHKYPLAALGWDFIQLLFLRDFFCGSSSGREILGQARKQTEQWLLLLNQIRKTACPCCEKNGRSKNMSPFIDHIPPRPCGSRTWPRDGFSVKNTRFLGIFNPRADSY